MTIHSMLFKILFLVQLLPLCISRLAGAMTNQNNQTPYETLADANSIPTNITGIPQNIMSRIKSEFLNHYLNLEKLNMICALAKISPIEKFMASRRYRKIKANLFSVSVISETLAEERAVLFLNGARFVYYTWQKTEESKKESK